MNIEELYDKYSKSLFFTSLRITGDSFDAEEAMQDTFIRYYQHSGKTGIKNPESWLRSVCIRRSIDILRNRNRDKDFIEEWRKTEPDNTELPDSTAQDEHKELHLKVETIKFALENLPDGYRIILSLNLFEGYDYKEIAGILKVKESTVRTQYMRGKARLLQILEKPF